MWRLRIRGAKLHRYCHSVHAQD